MELKDRLKNLRVEANLTQEELANQIFVSRTLVSKWESGDRYPSQENLARLAIIFQITPEELIGGQKEKDQYRKFKILSIVYSAFCWAVMLGILSMLGVAFAEHLTLQNGWTGIGGFVFSIMLGVPIIAFLVLVQAVLLKKKNGYKTLELYSLFALILLWLLSIPLYLLMG